MRALAFLLALLLTTHGRAQVWPLPEGAGTAQTVGGRSPTGGNSVSATFSTSSKVLSGLTPASTWGGVVVVVDSFALSGAAAPTVSSVTSTHLTFTKVSGASVAFINSSFNEGQDLETWIAPLDATLSGEVITVTLSGAPACAAAIAYDFDGAVLSVQSPFDPLAASKGTATTSGTGPPAIAGISTANNHDLLLWGSGGLGSAANWSPPTGFTTIAQAQASLGGAICTIGAGYKSLSATVSSQSYQSAVSGNGASSIFAITGDGSSGGATANNGNNTVARAPLTHW